ncbi:Adenosylmethionine-8-amino-7-oxononanoate aminotransferase [Buchnera aphidicola (Thelaxes suberi)]|uniref:adenosylmethionine--8-amino-7-oxononanoate transaminase n=1 Tax=Buchnera aphidicola TaxID=9 RepID=UPI0034644DEC
MNKLDLIFDQQHIWHPYSSISKPIACYPVIYAKGIYLTLSNKKKLIDGMSSWWSVIHGYNHPRLNRALRKQINKVSHVMFGGITHKPAINLCRKLVQIASKSNLECVFLSDSGSVSIEVAMKMAIQYWQALGKKKKFFLTIKGGYHGDTFFAMSVSDPDNSFHNIYYDNILIKNLFANAPKINFFEKWDKNDVNSFKKLISDHYSDIIAIIIEPIVQGVGGMKFYHPNYLKEVKNLSILYQIPLIIDEIATGFCRTGKFFAHEYANIQPDILCIGKALTGGMLTLSATLTTRNIAETISNGKSRCFMHGPTFMGNPLSCSVAVESINIIQDSNWKNQIITIEKQLKYYLSFLKNHRRVREVRVLGAIGVVECTHFIQLTLIQRFFVEKGVWIRPFKNLIYLVPAFIISHKEIKKLVHIIHLSLDYDIFFENK